MLVLIGGTIFSVVGLFTFSEATGSVFPSQTPRRRIGTTPAVGSHSNQYFSKDYAFVRRPRLRKDHSRRPIRPIGGFSGRLAAIGRIRSRSRRVVRKYSDGISICHQGVGQARLPRSADCPPGRETRCARIGFGRRFGSGAADFTVLIIDDFHLIEDSAPILELMNAFLRELPPALASASDQPPCSRAANYAAGGLAAGGRVQRGAFAVHSRRNPGIICDPQPRLASESRGGSAGGLQ